MTNPVHQDHICDDTVNKVVKHLPSPPESLSMVSATTTIGLLRT